jgi:hypothetical protein
MKQSWQFIFSLVFAWILWERIVILTNQSEQWFNQTSYVTQQLCTQNASRIIDERRNDYLRRGLSAAYIIFDEGIGGFFVDDKERHIFMCYSSDFDPRPRKS